MLPPILVATGLKREAALLTAPSVIAVAGGGDGAALAERLEAALAAHRPGAVVSIGLGGALSRELEVGDWVVGERIVGEGPTWACTPGLVEALRVRLAAFARPLTLATFGQAPPSPARGKGGSPGDSAPLPLREREGPTAQRWEGEGSRDLGSLLVGAIAASDVMVVDAAAKTALYASTGALAVDMESHVAARLAAAHGLPFAALRVISDAADRALPRAAQAGMKKDGEMDILAVLKELAKDPRQLPALIRTGREAEVAFRRLALLRRYNLLGRLGVGDPDLGELLLHVT